MKKRFSIFAIVACLLIAGCGTPAPAAVATPPASVPAPTATPLAPTATPLAPTPAAPAAASAASQAPTPEKVLFGNFSSIDLKGDTYTQEIFQNADLTMINIWGTFCGPCINEMPDLGKLAKKYADKGFQIVGIACDVTDKEYLKLAKDIVNDTGANYLHLLPSADLNKIKLNYVQYIPETVFVDKAGYIVGEPIVGSQSKEDWEKKIQELLKEVSNG